MNSTAFYRRVVILNATVPLLILLCDAGRGLLGANAVNQALHITGILSLIFLILSLLITPLKQLTGWASLIAVRRALGLSGFWYALLHLTIYFVYDRNLSVSSMFIEITSRRFLQVGVVAIALMVPLAITSTNSMIRRLGAKRWKRLHRVAYVVAILGVVHYSMLVKSDIRQPIAFAVVLTPILGFRAVSHYRNLTIAARQATPLSKPVSQTADKAKSRRLWQGQLRVARIFDETHDVKTFRITATDGKFPFSYAPGQYLNLQLTIDGKPVRRSYTISSAPTQHAYCEITVKRDGVASQFLHANIHEGALIDISAPAGKFVFLGHESNRVTLISGGVGNTPLMPIYLCGPDGMMKATRELLVGCGVPNDAILIEAFVSPRAATPVSADADGKLTAAGASSQDIESDAATAAVITFSPGGVVIDIAAATTVLEAAEEAGVTIPFECRSGICGQCKVRCESGSVVMASRDALSDSEQDAGYILACQARPSSAEVHVRLL